MKKKMTTFIVGTSGEYNVTVCHHTQEEANEVIANLNKPK